MFVSLSASPVLPPAAAAPPPPQVIFRSCKLIPTMVIAVVWRKKIVSRWEFLAAFAVCAGLIIFAGANRKLEPDFDFRGIAMVMLSVCADAFLPNMQVKKRAGGSVTLTVTVTLPSRRCR